MVAGGKIGALTIDGDATATQASDLQVKAGGAVGNVTIRANTAALGSLVDSSILAGQSMVIDGATVGLQTAQLLNGTLGKVSVSGSLTNSKLVAASNIGAVTVSGDMQNSLLLAGAEIGATFAVDGNGSYIQQAKIASVKVTGAFTSSSIAAGVTPGADSVFGNSDDTAALNAGLLTTTSQIGSLVFGAGTTTSSTAVLSAGGTDHNFAIESAALSSLQIGALAQVKVFTSPTFIDATNNGEDASDVLVKLKTL